MSYTEETVEIRIESDGTPLGTYIYDSNTGARLNNVTALEWKMDVSNSWPDSATVTMTLINVPVDLSGKAVVTVEDVA